MSSKWTLEDEVTGSECGLDYTSFVGGYNCINPATRVIIEDYDGEKFHSAHLCARHAQKEFEKILADEIEPSHLAWEQSGSEQV